MRWIGALLLLAWAGPVFAADDPLPYRATPNLMSVDGAVIWFTVQGPSSYVSATPADIPPNAVRAGPVHGEACQHGLSLPFSANLRAQSGKVSGAAGDGGYIRALEEIKRSTPNVAGIYDVQVDVHRISVLTIYSRICTDITATAFTLRG